MLAEWTSEILSLSLFTGWLAECTNTNDSYSLAVLSLRGSLLRLVVTTKLHFEHAEKLLCARSPGPVNA